MIPITLPTIITTLLSILTTTISFLTLNQHHPLFVSKIQTNNNILHTTINNIDNVPNNNPNPNVHRNITNYLRQRMRIRKMENYSLDGVEVEVYHLSFQTGNDVRNDGNTLHVNATNHTEKNISDTIIDIRDLDDTLIQNVNVNDILEVTYQLMKTNPQKQGEVGDYTIEDCHDNTNPIMNISIEDVHEILTQVNRTITTNENKHNKNTITKEDVAKIIQTIHNNMNNTIYNNQDTNWKQEMSILKSRIHQLKKSQPILTPPESLTRQVLQYNLHNFLLTLDNTLLPIVHSCVTSILGSIVPTRVKVSGSVLQQVCTNYIMTGYVIHYIQDVIYWNEVFQLDLYQDELGIVSKFHELDINMDGFLDYKELKKVFQNKYKDNPVPQQDILSCMNYLDDNNDGLISEWEFLRGVKSWCTLENIERNVQYGRILYKKQVNTPHDVILQILQGNVTVEYHNDTIMDIDIQNYIFQLQKEYTTIQQQLQKEYRVVSSTTPTPDIPSLFLPDPKWIPSDNIIMNYLSSIQNDVSGVTKLSPDVMETIQLLNQHVLHGKTGYFKISLSGEMDKRMTSGEPLVVTPDMLVMEMSGIGLQQMCMWSWMMGYGLREEEGNGNYRKILE